MLIILGAAVCAIVIIVYSVRAVNRLQALQGQPTLFQGMKLDVRKDVPPLPRRTSRSENYDEADPLPKDLDGFTEVQTQQCMLDITTFLVRFVCRDRAFLTLTHPSFGTVRQELGKHLQDALVAAEASDFADATPAQQVKACSLIMNDQNAQRLLLRYIVDNLVIIRGMRSGLTDPRILGWTKIKYNSTYITPSEVTMTWLRLLHDEEAKAS